MPGDFREISRGSYTPSEGSSRESINIGSLQRIADAAEKMAVNHVQLIEDRDKYKRWYMEERAQKGKLQASFTATQGVVTRFRHQIADLSNRLAQAEAKIAAQGMPVAVDTQPKGGT